MDHAAAGERTDIGPQEDRQRIDQGNAGSDGKEPYNPGPGRGRGEFAGMGEVQDVNRGSEEPDDG